MIKFFDRNASRIAAVVLAGGISLSLALALSACSAGHAVDETQTSGVTVESQAAQGRIETHIQQLHDRLQITPAQEPRFEAVANVIRSNERTMHALVEKRHVTGNATAVEDLESYKQIADAHAAGLARLIPAFEDLYDTMSDAQRANADKVFSNYEGKEWYRKHHGHKKAAK